MTQLETLLQQDATVQQFALSVLKECSDMREFSARCLETLINAAMSHEADEACGASCGRRSEERVNSRNGYRERGLETTVGDLTLKVPKLRHGSYYPEGVIERYQRADRALIVAIMEMYANGTSTRRIERMAERLGISSPSKSQVSRMCEELDAEVAELQGSGLSSHVIRYMWIDATYVSCRVDHRFVKVAVVTAIGLDEDGRRRFLGVDVFDSESYEGWRAFLQGLEDRGLNGVRHVVSDAHAGIVRAVAELFQNACWQRCITHLMRNAADAEGGDSRRTMVRELPKATFAQRDPLLVRACYQKAIDELASRGCNKSAELLETAEGDALAYLQFPLAHGRKIRTNNIQLCPKARYARRRPPARRRRRQGARVGKRDRA